MRSCTTLYVTVVSTSTLSIPIYLKNAYVCKRRLFPEQAGDRNSSTAKAQMARSSKYPTVLVKFSTDTSLEAVSWLQGKIVDECGLQVDRCEVDETTLFYVS